MVCSGKSHWAICSNGLATFQEVAAGTVCSCSQGDCAIGLASGGPNGSGVLSSAPFPTAGPTAPKAPALTVTITHSSKSAAAPTAYSSAPAPSSPAPAVPSSGTPYKMYQGNGEPTAGWPTQSEWIGFEQLWSLQSDILGANCENAFGVPNNSPQDNTNIKAAILAEATKSGVDARFILAEMMQESLGCIFVDTTQSNGGVTNTGMFQSHDGSGTCYQKSECPASEITLQIQNGVTGTSSGAGLQQCISQSHATDVSKYYKAARIYNSGSIASSGDLSDGEGATNCYSSDVANRLLGWIGSGSCSLDG